MGYRHKKEGALSLLPFLIFIVIYLGAGIYFQIHGVEMAFYQFPSVTAMFIAVLSAFFMGDETLQVKFGIFSRGAGNENVMTMLMIYILAGAFSAVAAAMGGRDATVNLGISFVPAQYLTAGIFIISAFMGTWNTYLWPMMVTNQNELRTIQVGVTMLNFPEGTVYGPIMAASILALLPIAVIFVIFRRQIVGGLMGGAVKG